MEGISGFSGGKAQKGGLNRFWLVTNCPSDFILNLSTLAI